MDVARPLYLESQMAPSAGSRQEVLCMLTPKHNGHYSLAGLAVKRQRTQDKPTILVAEDNADSREMMHVLLESKGYVVFEAADGLRAVDVALEEHPDLILIDLQLPKMDGLMVTRNLRAHDEFKHVPIVLLTGFDPSRYRQAAIEAGCNDYLLKPIDFERLDLLLHMSLPPAIENTCA